MLGKPELHGEGLWTARSPSRCPPQFPPRIHRSVDNFPQVPMGRFETMVRVIGDPGGGYWLNQLRGGQNRLSRGVRDERPESKPR